MGGYAGVRVRGWGRRGGGGGAFGVGVEVGVAVRKVMGSSNAKGGESERLSEAQASGRGLRGP